MSGHNDWESDLSSIIEKTNQNLKLLRRIGDRRTDLGGGGASYDVSTTSSRPGTASAAQIASEMRSFASSISNRYAAEDAAASSSRHRHASTTAIPRAASAGVSTSGSRKLHRSSSVEVDRARARESLIIRPAAPTTAFAGTSDGEDESDERSPRVRHAPGGGGGSTRVSNSASGLKRSSSLSAKSRSGGSSSTRASATAVHGSSNNAIPGMSPDGVALDELRKSLEVHIASRSSAFEKALGDLRTDFTVVTSETNSLAMKMQELRDAVNAKLSNVTTTTTSVGEHGESIGRLEKHSAVLLGWKVGVDQDLFEISSKLKSFASIQEKVTSVESHLESLGTAIKAASRSARHDEKIEELKDRLAMLERQASTQMDSKAVEHTVQMRVSKEINELESRFNQSLQFLTQKIESKLQAIEKNVQSDRIEAVASLKSELLEDVDKLESRVVKKQELTPIQNAHTQMKDDIAHMQLFFERQDKRFQELKQNSTQIRDELVETRHELTKALHAQQNRVSTTLEEKVGQLTILTKDKNAKAEQKVVQLEKRFKKVEEQCRHLQDSVSKVKQDAISRQAADSVAQQRETEKLRQRLVRSIAELEQLQIAKSDLERSYETQDRQHQAKLKELRAQIDEQERLNEALRTEMLQNIQTESRHIGVAQGRNALLESLLSREKQESEEKAQQIHKSRQEIAQIRQKMRTLEHEVEKKMQKLSSELQTKQSQIDSLTKKLTRSEDDAQKLSESSKREKKLLTKTKELKQQELALTKMRLKELEKAASTASLTKVVETKAIEDLTPRLTELEGRRNELQLQLAERQVEIEELRSELQTMKVEREELIKKHDTTMDAEAKRLNAEFGQKIDALRGDILAKDTEIQELRESLVDKSELATLADALAQNRQEKQALLEQLHAIRTAHEHQMSELESSLSSTHSAEMAKLQTHIESRVAEIAEAQRSIEESRERIASLESEVKISSEVHKEEVSRLAAEMKATKLEAERLSGELEELRAQKSDVETQLGEARTTLESISAGDEELLEEMDNLRQQHEELSAERQRLIEGLRSKSDEIAELTQVEAQHRERIAQVLQEQKDAELRVEREIESMRQTVEHERDAAAESELQLKRMIDVLQAELDAAKKQVHENTASASRLQIDLQSITRELEASAKSEACLKERLRRIVEELTSMGVASVDEEDPCEALHSHFSHVGEKHAHELAVLSSNHDQALKEAAADHEHAHELETQITSLTVQIQDLDISNQELKSELEEKCSAHARLVLEVGRLQDEMSVLLDQKHALEEEVAELTSRVEELDSTLQNQAEEKATEVNELKKENAKLSKTVSDIRASMERIEQNKLVELENLNADIQELEATLITLNERPRGTGKDGASMEKEFFENQQAVVTAGQALRAMFAKLNGGCSVVELHDLKASLVAAEDKRSQNHDHFCREKRRLEEMDEEVLLNVNFLEALVKGWNTDDCSFATKYVQVAPSLASRLRRLQELFVEVLEQCAVPSSSLDDGGVNEPADEAVDNSCVCNVVDDEAQANANETFEDDELDDDLDEIDDDQQSGEFQSSLALDESDRVAADDEVIDDRALREKPWSGPPIVEQEEAHCNTTPTDYADRSRLSVDVASAHIESCTTLVNSPKRAVLSSDLFRPRLTPVANMASTPHLADTSVSLLQSSRAELLDQRFEPALHDEMALDEDDESSAASPCTSLPNSPRGELLEERVRPLPVNSMRQDEVHEHDDESESECDHEEVRIAARSSPSETSPQLQRSSSDCGTYSTGSVPGGDDGIDDERVHGVTSSSGLTTGRNLHAENDGQLQESGDNEDCEEEDELDASQMGRMGADDDEGDELDASQLSHEDGRDGHPDHAREHEQLSMSHGDGHDDGLDCSDEDGELDASERSHRSGDNDEQDQDHVELQLDGPCEEGDRDDLESADENGIRGADGGDPEDSLSQSSESMVRFAADERAIDHGTICVAAQHHDEQVEDAESLHDGSGDDLIDDESDGDEVDDDGDERTIMATVTVPIVDHHETLHNALRSGQDESEEAASDEEESADSPSDARLAEAPSVSLSHNDGDHATPLEKSHDKTEDSAVDRDPSAPLPTVASALDHGLARGVEESEFADLDEGEELDGSLDSSAAEDGTVPELHVKPTSVSPLPLTTSLVDHDLPPTDAREDETKPSIQEHEYIRDHAALAHYDSTNDLDDADARMAEIDALDASHDESNDGLQLTRELDVQTTNHDVDEEASSSEFDQSADFDGPESCSHEETDPAETVEVPDPSSRTGAVTEEAVVVNHDSDDELPASLPASMESSPEKPFVAQLSTTLPSIPSLPLTRLAALQSDSDHDELHAAQLSMDLQRRGMASGGDGDEFDDSQEDLPESSRVEDEEDSDGFGSSTPFGTGVVVTEHKPIKDADMTERIDRELHGDAGRTVQDDHLPVDTADHREASSTLGSLQATLSVAAVRRDVCDINPTEHDGYEGVEEDLPFEDDGGLDDSRGLGEEEMSADEESLTSAVLSSLMAESESIDSARRPHDFIDKDEQEHSRVDKEGIHGAYLHADNDDDFDQPLSASREDDEADISHSEMSMDGLVDAPHGHDDDGECDRDCGFEEDSMDEVERLLLQHAEKTMPASNAYSETIQDRQFTSALRMEDDEDELIDSDSDSDEDADGEMGASAASHTEDDDSVLVTGKEPFAAQDHDPLSDSRDENEDSLDHLSPFATSAHSDEPRERHVNDDDASGVNGEDEETGHGTSIVSDDDDAVAEVASPPVAASFTSTSRALKNFDESDDEGEDKEPRPAVTSMAPLSSQLPPLSGLGSRARAPGGSGSLMKALHATRVAMSSSDSDDDMDEVEKLMATQRQLRKPIASVETTLSAQTSLTHKSHDEDFDDVNDNGDDGDHEERQDLSVGTRSSSVKEMEAEKRHGNSVSHAESVEKRDADALAESQVDADFSEREDGDASFDDASGTFGMSFGDDVLERALQGSTRAAPTTATLAAPNAFAAVTSTTSTSRTRPDSDSEDDDESNDHDLRTASLASTFGSSASLLGRSRTLGALQPLPSLGKKPLHGLGALVGRRRAVMDEDMDDMDEVERLLLEQSSMRSAKPASTPVASSIRRSKHAEDDDAFDADAIPVSPLKDTNLPADDDEFAHFDRDDEDEVSPRRRRDQAEASGSESETQGSAPSSPSKIPILPGSSLLKKTFGGATSPTRSPVKSRPRMASARSEEDGADEYLEDSFDLEESLQEDEEDV